MRSVPDGQRQKRRPWLKWAAVLAVGVLCVILGWGYPSQTRAPKQVVSDIRRLGGDVVYSSQASYVEVEWPFPPAGPTWCLELCDPQGIRGLLPSWMDSEWLDSVAAVRLGAGRASRGLLADIAGLPGLEYLDLRGAELDADDLQLLADCRSLRYLHVNRLHFDSADLGFLRDIRSLEELYLVEANITDQGLESMVPIPNLRRLWLDDTQITSAGVANLTTCSKLEQLSLRGTRVDDNALPHLRRLPLLSVLELYRTSVTQTGVNDLRIALPNCKVYYELGQEDW